MNIETAPKLSLRNRASIASAGGAVCYFCFHRCAPADIEEYVDDDAQTALCPRCSLDALLPENPQAPYAQETLKATAERWFGKPVSRTI